MAFTGREQHDLISRLLSIFKPDRTDHRVNAFFSCVPIAYCGFHKNEDPIWSSDFTDMLGVSGIRRLEDIQESLSPSDAAALEGYILQLQETGEAFTLDCTAEKTGIHLRLYGRLGNSEGTNEPYLIFWAQDISQDKDRLEDARTEIETAKKRNLTLSVLLDHLPVPVWARNADKNITYCNETYGQWVQKDTDSVVQDNIKLPVTPQKDALQFESRGRIIVDGKRRIIDIVERDDAETGIQTGFVVDGTEEDRIRTELTRLNRATQELLGNLTSAIAVFAADTTLEFYNTAFSSLWDLKESSLNTKPSLGNLMEQLREERKLPEQADFRSFKKSWVDLFTSLLEPKQEMLYLPDGRALRMLSIPHPMGGLMMTFEDVTSRLELESSYNTLIAVQRETLDNLNEGVAVFGSNGQLRLWNPVFRTLWSIEEEFLAKQPHISDLVTYQKHLFDEGKPWQHARETLTSFALSREDQQTDLVLNNGIHLECVTVSLPDGGKMVTFRDMTDAVQAEKALTERNMALEAADNLKTEFLANVSYQLRTPLNTIMGFGEILTNGFFGPLNERQNEYAMGITEAGTRLTALIDDILDLASIEAGKLELDIERTPIQTMLNGLFDIARDWAAREDLIVTLDCPEEVGFAEIDPRRIQQALVNLIQNAITYTPTGGHITLIAENRGKDSVAITVQDTGVGMEDADIETLLKPFTRGTAQDNSGSGLGLTIVQHMADLHDGRLEIASTPDRGTQATLILPRRHKKQASKAA